MSFSAALKSKAAKVWEAGYNHPFVQELGRGTLARDKFKFYLLQDYLYLLQYAKVFALAVTKTDDEQTMTRLTRLQHSILAGEMDIHRGYMADFGISPTEAQTARASLFNRAYTANMLAVGQSGDVAEILAAVFPCAWTYGDYGRRLKDQYAAHLPGNYYKSWIEGYASDDYAQSYAWFFETLDSLAAEKSPAQRARLEEIFISSVEFEYLFWDMSYKRQMSYNL